MDEPALGEPVVAEPVVGVPDPLPTAVLPAEFRLPPFADDGCPAARVAPPLYPLAATDANGRTE